MKKIFEPKYKRKISIIIILIAVVVAIFFMSIFFYKDSVINEIKIDQTYVAKEKALSKQDIPSLYIFSLKDDGSFVLSSNVWYLMDEREIEHVFYDGSSEDALDKAEIIYYQGHYKIDGEKYILYFDEEIDCTYESVEDLINDQPVSINYHKGSYEHFEYSRILKREKNRYYIEEKVTGGDVFKFYVIDDVDDDLWGQYMRLKKELQKK